MTFPLFYETSDLAVLCASLPLIIGVLTRGQYQGVSRSLGDILSGRVQISSSMRDKTQLVSARVGDIALASNL